MTLLLVVPSTAYSEGNWFVNGSLQFNYGNYIYDTGTSTYYLYGGIRYQSEALSLSANVPVIGQNTDLVSQGGNMLLPGQSNSESMGHGSGHHGNGHRMSISISDLIIGIGDIFTYATHRLWKESSLFPGLSFSGQIKFPTASEFGTGEFDFGAGINLKKKLGDFATFLDLGYLNIGDPDSLHYQNPFTFGVGLGRLFQNGKMSVIVYLQAYTEVLEKYDPPAQGSLGMLYLINDRSSLSIFGLFGLTNTSPDFGVSIGLERKL
jgi:hypothetical protein